LAGLAERRGREAARGRGRDRDEREGRRRPYPLVQGRRAAARIAAGIDGRRCDRQQPAWLQVEDKGIFAHTPLGFAVFQEILKTGQKQLYFAVLDYFENPETLQTLYKYYVAFFEQFMNTT
jgi:hypothetical protein